MAWPLKPIIARHCTSGISSLPPLICVVAIELVSARQHPVLQTCLRHLVHVALELDKIAVGEAAALALCSRSETCKGIDERSARCIGCPNVERVEIAMEKSQS